MMSPTIQKWERDEGYFEVNTLLVMVVKLDISLDVFLEDEFSFLKKGKNNKDMMEKYPGVVAGLKVLADY